MSEALGRRPAEKPTLTGPVPLDDAFDKVLSKTDEERIANLMSARTPEQADTVHRMLEALIVQVKEKHIQRNEPLQKSLDRAITRLDTLLTNQLNPILHDKEFQRVESTWRGLHYLVHQSRTGPNLKIRVLDVNKDDLRDDLLLASEFDQSGLAKLVYSDEFGTPGGKPYGCLIGDLYFGNNDLDLALLEKIAQVAAAAHAPFFASADPTLLLMNQFDDLPNRPQLSTIFEGADYARWRSFREKPQAKYVGLCLPKTLGRLPYGDKTDRVRAFGFTEDVSGDDSKKFLWTNAAWSMGARLTDSFSRYSWCSMIAGATSGGKVADLPLYTFKADDGTIAAQCPTEIAITDSRDGELDRLGLIPLCHYKDTNYAVFFGAQSCYKPREFFDAGSNASEELSADMLNTLAVSRFAHYLKVIQRDNLNAFREREDVERELQEWISNYVLIGDNASEALKAERPLRSASITVIGDPARPGHYKAQMKLRPHFRMKELLVTIMLVLDNPAK